MSRSAGGVSYPGVCRLRSVESSPKEHSGCLSMHVYQHPGLRPAGPKVQRRDSAVVGPACGAACTVYITGEAQLLQARCASRPWYLKGQSIDESQP